MAILNFKFKGKDTSAPLPVQSVVTRRRMQPDQEPGLPKGFTGFRMVCKIVGADGAEWEGQAPDFDFGHGPCGSDVYFSTQLMTALEALEA